MSYIYFIEKASCLIHKLMIGEGDAKSRLRECHDEIYTIYIAEVPTQFQNQKDKIFERLEIKGKSNQSSAFNNTLLYMRNKQASNIIRDIYSLYLNVKDYYGDYKNENKNHS